VANQPGVEMPGYCQTPCGHLHFLYAAKRVELELIGATVLLDSNRVVNGCDVLDGMYLTPV